MPSEPTQQAGQNPVPRFNGVELRVNGQVLPWWTGFSFTASVDDLCTSADIAVTVDDLGYMDKVDENSTVELWATNMDAAALAMSGAHSHRGNGKGQSNQPQPELLATCRVDCDTRQVSATDQTIQLALRSLGRELVDCQMSGSHNGVTLGEIIKRLCAKLKVPFVNKAKTQLVKQFSMQSESPHNNISQLVRAANLLLHPTPDGGIVLTEPANGAVLETFTYGQHFTRYTYKREHRLRFSHYCVKGQASMRASATSGKSEDKGYSFYRPLEMVADKDGGTGGCERRAQLELVRRKARANTLELSVPGWFNHNGKLRAINTLVRVVIEREGIDSTFLIGDLVFKLDSGGQVCELTLQHRNAYIGQEPPAKQRKKSAQKTASKASSTSPAKTARVTTSNTNNKGAL